MSTTCSVGARTITVSGPLEDHVGAFADALVGWGFTEYSATAQLRVAADFSAWMDDLDVDLAGLTSELVDQYLERRRRRYAAFHTRLALRHLLGFLADWGLAAGEATGLVKPPRSELMEGFRAHLLQDRRLAWLTAEAHVARAARFVDVYAPEGVASLDAGILARAVIDEAKDHAPGSVQAFQATLRAFLRFCWLTRRIEHDLRGAVVPAGAPAGSRLPVGVSRSDMERLLLSCNRATAIGRRDYAVLVLLTALGLRAGEVAKLKLKDIDWLHGEILIRGKGSKEERLPLPQRVGAAIEDYLLNTRPVAAFEEVFLSWLAPLRPMGQQAVSNLIHRACARAGIGKLGPHRLRHSLGEAMITAGVPLAAIGQVMRHDHPQTTANYARVDVGQLRDLARPWPRAEAQR